MQKPSDTRRWFSLAAARLLAGSSAWVRDIYKAFVHLTTTYLQAVCAFQPENLEAYGNGGGYSPTWVHECEVTVADFLNGHLELLASHVALSLFACGLRVKAKVLSVHGGECGLGVVSRRLWQLLFPCFDQSKPGLGAFFIFLISARAI